MLPLTTGKLLELWNQTPKRIISLFPIQQGTPTSWARCPRNSSAAERFHTWRFGKSLQKQLSVLRRSSPSQANDFRGSIRGCQVHVHHFGVLCDRNGSASAPFHETKAWTGEWQRWLSKVCLWWPSPLLVVAKKFKIRVFELVKNQKQLCFGYLFTIFHTEPLSYYPFIVPRLIFFLVLTIWSFLNVFGEFQLRFFISPKSYFDCCDEISNLF